MMLYVNVEAFVGIDVCVLAHNTFGILWETCPSTGKDINQQFTPCVDKGPRVRSHSCAERAM